VVMVASGSKNRSSSAKGHGAISGISNRTDDNLVPFHDAVAGDVSWAAEMRRLLSPVISEVPLFRTATLTSQREQEQQQQWQFSAATDRSNTASTSTNTATTSISNSGSSSASSQYVSQSKSGSSRNASPQMSGGSDIAQDSGISTQNSLALAVEPRSIQEMVSNPKACKNEIINDDPGLRSLWYELIPALTYPQQMACEYSMPLSITGSFYIYNTPALVVGIGTVLVILHVFQIFATSYEGSTNESSSSSGKSEKLSSTTNRCSSAVPKVLNPVEHLLIDSMWMQCLFSFFFWLGPHFLGPYCIQLGMAFVWTVPMNTSFSLKTHFVKSVGNLSSPQTPEALKKKRCMMGNFVRDCMLCYGIAELWLYYASQHHLATSAYRTPSTFLTMAVFYLNSLPLVFGARYMKILNSTLAEMAKLQIHPKMKQN